jgi:hypothetical protein
MILGGSVQGLAERTRKLVILGSMDEQDSSLSSSDGQERTRFGGLEVSVADTNSQSGLFPPDQTALPTWTRKLPFLDASVGLKKEYDGEGTFDRLSTY